MRLIVLALLSMSVLSACGSDAPPPPPPPPPPAAPAPTVLDDQLKAIDKAKAVEQQLMDEKAKQDKALEDAGG